MSKKIAVLITDEFEDSEFTSPADEFRKAGHEVIHRIICVATIVLSLSPVIL